MLTTIFLTSILLFRNILLYLFVCVHASKCFLDAFAQDNFCPSTQWLYDETSNSCFLPSKHHSSFNDAMLFCRGLHLNATLTIILNELIETAVNSIVYNEDSNSLWWIGLLRTDPQSPFLWIDGTALNYTDWQPGQPSNSLGANCVGVFLRTASNGGWQNVQCGQLNPFICYIANAAIFPTTDPKICPPGRYQSPTGSIHSPNYPADYPNNADCYYLITVAAGFKVNITIVMFRTEQCCDWVYIHDGTLESSPYIASWFLKGKLSKDPEDYSRPTKVSRVPTSFATPLRSSTMYFDDQSMFLVGSKYQITEQTKENVPAAGALPFIMGYFTNKVTQQPLGKLSVADYRHQDWTDYHYNRFRNKVWPLSAHSLLCTIGVIAFLHFEAVNPSFGCIDYIQDNFFPPIVGRNIVTLALSVGLFAMFVWFVFDQSLRYMISFILRYKGWVYDPVGHPSFATRIYMLFIKLLQRREPLFFSYQGVIPALPLPTLQATVDKYLKSVRPLLNDEEYDRQKKLADDFFSAGTAYSLQTRLRLKWLTSKNYVTDWWKEIVYMRHRGSLIKTNMAGVDVIFRHTTKLPAARAANLVICNRMFENEIIHHQTMKPVTAGGVPLCAMQYQDFYRSLRVPGIETDHMIKVDETARHVVVYCKGCWYKVNIFAGDRLLKASEIERAFQMIIDGQPDPSPGEEYLSALTGGDRAVWAKIRSEEFSSGLNKEALDTIENALDVIWFDEEFRTYDERDPSLLDRDYARALHCDGFKCWWDKPQNMFFSANGKYTSTAEHSVCDALIFVHISEYQKYHENYTLGYTTEGHARGAVELVPQPQRVRFDIGKETQGIITKTLTDNLALVHDYDNAAFIFYDYGKNFIKKCKVSPDAFLQMALQLAHYKDQKKFALTYEPTMARLWRDGRTETVRSCTKESVDFVMTMLDPAATSEEKLSKLRVACEVHQQNYRDSMAGRGCDRHLFALRVVSKYYGIESPFLDAVFAQSFELSTSQTPQHQQEDLMKLLGDQKDFFWPSGSFACPDGSKYGVCYTVGATGDILSFHISTWHSVPDTDAKRFRSTVMNTLREMKHLVGEGKSK